MQFRRTELAAVAVGMSMLACSAFQGLAEPTTTEAAPVESTPPPLAGLTVEQVLNAEYTVMAPNGNETTIQFTDGAYRVGDPGSADFADIHIVAVSADQRVVLGDLNGDGAGDAAVLIAENYGGTGVFVSVAAVLNVGGQPRHAALYGIDDRPTINAFRIENGAIFVEALVHGPNDPACCPELPVTRTLQLIGEGLMLVGATSRTPDGTERAITIDSPADGFSAGGTLALSGHVTVAPFENTLVYRFYGEDGSELEGGPVMVAAAELGGPGNFEALIGVSALTPGPKVLVIADFSAADGSVLALDSVRFIIP